MKFPVKNPVFYTVIVCLLLVSTDNSQAAGSGMSLEQVIAGNHRDPGNAARDKYRHPKETLEFFGIQPDMTVIETLPGSGWYTEILAPYLRDHGTLIVATMLLSDQTPEYFRNRQATYYGKMDAAPEIYGNVVRTPFQKVKHLEEVEDNSVDMVIDSRNLHNYVRFGGGEELFAAYYRVLKPGGIIGVIDHRAPEGVDVKEFADTGYVPESYAIALAEKAGFKLAGKSEINANPKDTKDHPKGVWTLPPGFRLGNEDRDKYAAIGESDRLTMKFVKPAN